MKRAEIMAQIAAAEAAGNHNKAAILRKAWQDVLVERTVRRVVRASKRPEFMTRLEQLVNLENTKS